MAAKKMKKKGAAKKPEKIPEFKATAPYNFVSLPEKAVVSPLGKYVKDAGSEAERSRMYEAYIEKEGTLSGYIELQIKTATPCFVGGQGDNFFSVNGKPVIPGSSIRGMVRNLFKIVTAGTMRPGEDFTDQRMYFRSMAGNSNALGPHYAEIMLDPKREKTAGFLICKNKKYSICPAVYDTKEKNPLFTFNHISWNTESRSADIYTGEMTNLDRDTGEIVKKHHYYALRDADWGHPIPVPDNVVDDYKEDHTRRGFDLFENKDMKKDQEASAFTSIPGVNFVTPCFYTAENGKVLHFGFGPYYRVPYDNTTGAHVPEAVQDPACIDFTEAVFGNKDLWAGRVSFEDAYPEGEVHTKEITIRPLAEPKPTSFQLYLKQKPGTTAQHWDKRPYLPIRGYKLYWHQGVNAQMLEKQERDKIEEAARKSSKGKGAEYDKREGAMNPKTIGVVKEGGVFTTVIHFRHLSKVEAGALFSVLSLRDRTKKDVVYKIGMGKSIGMGSIRVYSSFYVEDEQKRYSQLLEENGWAAGTEKIEKKDLLYTECLEEFQNYMKEELGEDGTVKWDHAIDELGALLDFGNCQKQKEKWLNKTKMMTVGSDSYKYRDILPDALDFVKGILIQ